MGMSLLGWCQKMTPPSGLTLREKKMEIRDQMRMLLEALGKHDAVTRDLLIEHSDPIRAISKNARALACTWTLSQESAKLLRKSKLTTRLMIA